MNNITIVCAHYMPEIGYIEVHLSKILAELGLNVTVLTSTTIPNNYKKLVQRNNYPEGETQINKNLKVIRLPPLFSHNQIVISNGIKPILLKTNPTAIIVIGVNKIFPAPVFSLNIKVPIFTFLGNNSYNNRNKKNQFSAFIINFLKNKLTDRAVEESYKLLLYTNETKSILKEIITEKLIPLLNEKEINISLGFNSNLFYFDNNERKNTREKLGINENDIVFITSTRVEPIKQLELVIDSFNYLNNNNIHYVIIGFQDDDYGLHLKEKINQLEINSNIHSFSFSSPNQIRKLYNAADIGIWTQPSISLLEAMGTGLKVMIENHKSTLHLHNPKISWLYTKPTIKKDMQTSINEFSAENHKYSERNYRANYALENLSFKTLCVKLLKLINDF